MRISVLATFSAGLRSGLLASGAAAVDVLAVHLRSDPPHGYGPEVRAPRGAAASCTLLAGVPTCCTGAPRQVVFTIQQDAVADYELAAAFIKQQVRRPAAARTACSLESADTPLVQRYAAVFLQHEYGIFGGYRGELVVALVRAAGGAVPFVTTLHTVESVPSPMVQHTLTQLLAHSVAVTALSPSGCRNIDAWNTTVGAPWAAPSLWLHI